MTLKIVLKPGERLFIGAGQIFVESDSISKIHIDGKLPVVREKDYLPEDKAKTPAREIYLTLQRAYLEDDFDKYRDAYFRLTGELIASKPLCAPFLAQINEKLGAQLLYPALKAAIKLVQFDEGHIAEGEMSSHWEGF